MTMKNTPKAIMKVLAKKLIILTAKVRMLNSGTKRSRTLVTKESSLLVIDKMKKQIFKVLIGPFIAHHKRNL